MKKIVIGLFLATTIICSTFIGVLATNDTNPHSPIKPPPVIINPLTNDTNPH